MIENIENILQEVQNCHKCKSIISYKKFSCTSHGKTDSKFMLVSEAPGKESVSNGKYWIGAGGNILRSCFTETDISLEDVFYLTDIVKCWPNENDENRTPTEAEILVCSSFLKREIESLKPKLVLSFGKKSSEYLLNKEISLKDSHGNTFDYNDATKVLVMYHPSGIDRFMKREIYKAQLKELFGKIIENKIDDIETIFQKQKDTVKPNMTEHRNNDSARKFKGLSFILPAAGNVITQSDISQKQLRITVDFKNHFPNKNTELRFVHNGIVYNVKFTHRGHRSHVLKLGSSLMQGLDLTIYDSVRITIINSSVFNIEKVAKS